MDINEQKKKRFEFLKKLYELSNADTTYYISFSDLGKLLELDFTESDKITKYFVGEDLLKYRGQTIQITHWGIKEVEELLENPEKATEHFLPLNIINVSSMTNSVIQQGNTNSSQTVTFNNSHIPELKEFTNELRSILNSLQLSVDRQNELLSEIQTLEIQLESPKPKNNILKEALKSIQGILTGVAANAATPVIMEKLNILMGYFGGA